MLYSHLQHMKRVFASPWSCRTTSSHLAWTSLLLRVSTQTQELTFRPTHLIQTLTAPFYLCDTDQGLQLPWRMWKRLLSYRWWSHQTNTKAQRLITIGSLTHSHKLIQIPQDWVYVERQLMLVHKLRSKPKRSWLHTVHIWLAHMNVKKHSVMVYVLSLHWWISKERHWILAFTEVAGTSWWGQRKKRFVVYRSENIPKREHLYYLLCWLYSVSDHLFYSLLFCRSTATDLIVWFLDLFDELL